MEICRTESLLHSNIAKFYQISESIKKCDYTNCINNDCTYNWNNLEKLLLPERKKSIEDPVYPKTYTEYLAYFQLVRPVLRQSAAVITQSIVQTDSNDTNWFQKLQWLGHQTQMQTILQEHFHPSSWTSTVENILFLTAILENGLANVYQTITKKCPPHLLRDLLDTKELKDVFGICPILFLKIIMGSAESINLRNIVWHGFPLPSEVPPCYTATLLILATSLSMLIEEKQITLVSRPQIRDLSRFVCKIKTASIDFTLLDDIAQMKRAIESSKWTRHSEHKLFWYQIIQHYHSKKYWQFVMLILPQIELLLRRMYGEANNFDITAKLEEYYITMNTIFESTNNRLISNCLDSGTLHFLYDIFISPYGMRIRDKVSHGEVDLNCIDRDLCSVLLYAGFNLITSNEDFPLDHYKSRFHLNNVAYECINASKRSVLQMITMKTPSSLGVQFDWNKESKAFLWGLKIIRPVQVFDRHKNEPEIVSIVMKIAQLVVQICENYKASFAERFKMFLNHELRSRSRKTLRQMIKAMSVIELTLQKIVQCMTELNNCMQTENHKWFEDRFENTRRFCKQTLKITENLVRFSAGKCNEWLNALEFCQRFQKISSNFITNAV